MKESKIWKEVDRILWKEWDPIGVSDYGGANDEYSSYVPSIVKLIEQDADELQIAKLLHQHSYINMGVASSLSKHLKIALKLSHLKDNF